MGTRSGRHMTSTSLVNSTRRRHRSSSRTLLETSDLVMSSLLRLSMRSSPPSTRTDLELLRRVRWSSSSSSSLVDLERGPFNHHSRVLQIQSSYNEDLYQSIKQL